MDPDLRQRIERWIDDDPNRRDRDELRSMLAMYDDQGTQGEALAARFSGRMAFGTAGLRGPIGAGPNRMNDAVVRQTTAGLADVLESEVEDALARGVVVGHDARRRSPEFAAEVVAVLTARGFRVFPWDRPTPTPTTPFMVRRLGAAAGIQVTASHNPPQDNGYKVYWDHAAQIVPPVDERIAARIDAHAASGPARYIPTCDADDPAALPRTSPLGDEALAAYREAVLKATPAPPDRAAAAALHVVYTAMHGVGQATLLEVLAGAGFSRVTPVAEQGEPDGAFPTVAFPNPEEPGALDLAEACASRVDADLIIANDPDADRLAVALPDGEGGWQMLTGNDLGALLGDFALAHDQGERPLVVASVVSSELLGPIAAHHGARFAQCLTGFKWVMAEARRATASSGARFVFGFEEALGYCLGDVVADKDGISAALALCSLAAHLKAQGRSLHDALGDLEARHGAWISGQTLRRFEGGDAQARMAEMMERVRAAPPGQVGDLGLRSVVDHLGAEPPSNLLELRYGEGLRVLVRPSGTEPKVKIYFEWRDPGGRAQGRRRLAELQRAWDEVDPS